MGGGGGGGGPGGVQPPFNGGAGLHEVQHVRSVFPETWLWTNVSVR